MRYFLLIFIVISSLTSINAKAETETTCVRNADGEIIVTAQNDVVTDTDENLGDSCQEIPDIYRYNFIKLDYVQQILLLQLKLIIRLVVFF